jgi:hypothetical protein
VSPARLVPYVGMRVRVIHFGVIEDAVVEDVLDAGRTLVVGPARFTLRRLNGHYVEESAPYYGPRLVLLGDEDEGAEA